MYVLVIFIPVDMTSFKSSMYLPAAADIESVISAAADIESV